MESPTRAKLNFSVNTNRVGLEEIRLLELKHGPNANIATRKTSMEDREKEWLAFFNSEEHILGRVCLASGFLERTTENGRLDWALIRPADESRVGQNLLPTSVDCGVG